MKIEILHKDLEEKWDQYVREKECATFFHQIAWRNLVVDLYGFSHFYVCAVEEDRIKGILPLFLTPHGPFKKKLVSVPFAVLGGVCADNGEIEEKLIKKAVEITESTDADFLELRNFYKVSGDLPVKSPYYTFILDLPDDSEIVWKSMHNEMRRCVRRSRDYGVKVDLNSNDLDKFYRIYSKANRDLGTPPSGSKWIKEVVSRFPENHRITYAYYEGKVVAAILVREYKDTVGAVFGHVIKEYRKKYPLYLLYWSLIEYACRRGFKKFDFGRSIEESGTFRFKKRWGAEPYRLHYQYFVPGKINIQDTSQSGTSRKKIAKIWKRLPVWASELLGPEIRKYYP